MYSKSKLPSQQNAIVGRDKPLNVEPIHFVNGNKIFAPFPEDSEFIYFGMGCFWGAERKFWQQEGVLVTAVGYGAGFTQNPTYEEVCTGGTGHTELVLVVWDKKITNFQNLIKVFFENHNPTQYMRQGGDIGTQYRSGIYTNNSNQTQIAKNAISQYQDVISKNGFGVIATEVVENIEFYYAETYHQQYLAKNPDGYCGLGGLGVSCPIGLSI
jgi:peptide-methionine (S)-S-oxide reductase